MCGGFIIEFVLGDVHKWRFQLKIKMFLSSHPFHFLCLFWTSITEPSLRLINLHFFCSFFSAFTKSTKILFDKIILHRFRMKISSPIETFSFFKCQCIQWFPTINCLLKFLYLVLWNSKRIVINFVYRVAH